MVFLTNACGSFLRTAQKVPARLRLMGTWRSPIDDEEEDGHMIRIAIPAEDLAILQAERYTHPHPRVQRKLHTLYWVGLGYPRHEVARIIDVS